MPDASFKEFVLDQLRSLPGLRAKAMFGGHGLYQANRFFGIVLDGRLYFKVDERSRPDYVTRGMKRFTYHRDGRTSAMDYHEVPADVLENPDELVRWAKRAVQSSES